MFANTVFQPAPDFIDPRLGPDFNSGHWPLCNGEQASEPGAPGLHQRRCAEFLAAFYQLNVLNQGLLDARAAGAPETSVKLLIEDIASAMNALEALEDRYAPIGFFGEPVMDGIRYHDIIFTVPDLPKIYPKAHSLSSHFSIPGLDEIPESELSGPANFIRLGHAKIDF